MNATSNSHRGHAKAIWIGSDAGQITFRDSLEFFFQSQDPNWSLP